MQREGTPPNSLGSSNRSSNNLLASGGCPLKSEVPPPLTVTAFTSPPWTKPSEKSIKTGSTASSARKTVSLRTARSHNGFAEFRTQFDASLKDDLTTAVSKSGDQEAVCYRIWEDYARTIARDIALEEDVEDQWDLAKMFISSMLWYGKTSGKPDKTTDELLKKSILPHFKGYRYEYVRAIFIRALSTEEEREKAERVQREYELKCLGTVMESVHKRYGSQGKAKVVTK